MKWYRRNVEGLDVPLDFCLHHDVVEDFNGLEAKLDEVEEWIDYGAVTLRVFALERFLSEADLALSKEFIFYAGSGGGTHYHQYLIGLAWLYLRSTGATPCRRGANACGYSGGWGDACIPGGNYFAECGTMRWDKLHAAMASGENLLILPYRSFAWEERFGADTHIAFEFRPKGEIHSYDDEDERQWVRDARAKLRIWPTKPSA